MIDISKLKNSKHVEVEFLDKDYIDCEFVKLFRSKYNLTQLALANILGVKKKTIEKWEQGKNKIGGSSAVLLSLIDTNKEILDLLYKVEYCAETCAFPIENPVCTICIECDDINSREYLTMAFNKPILAGV